MLHVVPPMPRYLSDHLRQQQAYPEDLIKHIIYQWYTREKKIAEIAVDLNMSLHMVKHILQLWCTTGEVMPLEPGKKNKRRRK
jgi:hypothetical protein